MPPESCAPGPLGYPSDCELKAALRARAEAKNRHPARSQAWMEALRRAAQVRLLLLDVDGVLSDGRVYYGDQELELKSFHTQDGFGLRLLKECDVEVALITGRQSAALRRRAEELGITELHQGAGDKLSLYEKILKERNLRPPQTACMGDDWPDLPLLNRAGLACAPANAVAEVRLRAHYVTEHAGGSGAVRELCDLLLEAQGCRERILARYDR